MVNLAQEVPILDESFDKVGSDLSTKQFFLVKQSTLTVALGAAATDTPLGVLQNKPTQTGEAPSVRTLGLSKVEAGGTFAAGDPLTSDGNGKAVKAAPAVGVNNGIWGWARSAGVDGEYSTMFVSACYLQTTD